MPIKKNIYLHFSQLKMRRNFTSTAREVCWWNFITRISHANKMKFKVVEEFCCLNGKFIMWVIEHVDSYVRKYKIIYVTLIIVQWPMITWMQNLFKIHSLFPPSNFHAVNHTMMVVVINPVINQNQLLSRSYVNSKGNVIFKLIINELSVGTFC